MKQLNHSPEAAAAVLGVSLKIAHERIACLRRRIVQTVPAITATRLAPAGLIRKSAEGDDRIASTSN